MSDVSQGHGWWLASDGKWYPPEHHPDYRPTLPPPPQAIPSIADIGSVRARSNLRAFLGVVLLLLGAGQIDFGATHHMGFQLFFGIVVVVSAIVIEVFEIRRRR